MATHLIKRNGPPTTAPDAIGVHYLDTLNKKAYFSVGTDTVNDWVSNEAAGVTWGNINGTLSNQIDLQNALDAKEDDLGNPSVNGYVLSSTTGGVRSWVENTGGGGGSTAWGSITGTLSNQTDLQNALDAKVDENAPITGDTKTKITYDAKGLVTAGDDATTDDIAEGVTNKYYPSADASKVAGIEAGAEVNNISDVNATDLTDSGDSSLHFHSSDRDRSNHTGTQTASTISDFDTSVSSNASVTANTAKVSADGSIDTHSDVDTSTVAPSNGQALIWNGTNWVPDDVASGSATWGSITGTLSAQTDLNDALIDAGDEGRITASTGLASGGVITINGGDNTRFDISDGYGYIVDNWTDPDNPTKTKVTWSGLTGITVTNIATEFRTNVAINSSGTIIQQSNPFDADDLRDLIILGRVVHANKTNINLVLSYPYTAYNLPLNNAEFIQVIGPINVDGNVYSPNGANLNLDKSAGDTYRLGTNYTNSVKKPNITTDPSGTAITFGYRWQNGSGGITEGPFVTAVDPEQYDDGSGTLAAVPNNKWTIQRVWYFGATNSTFMMYGQAVYDSLADAEANIFGENFNQDPNFAEATFRSFVIVKKGATDLSDSAVSKFIPANKYGTGPQGSLSTSTTTLQQAYLNSPNPEVDVTDTTDGALTVRDSATNANRDKIFEVWSTASADLFTVSRLSSLFSTGVGIGLTTLTAKLNVKGTGTTSATKTLALTNSSDVNLFTMNDNGTFNGLNLSIGEYTGAMRIGQDAATNATGSNWTAIGRNAGQNKTTGNNWTAIGSNAGQSNTTSGFWTCVGYNAGTSNTTGAGWTCVGTNAAQMNTIGDNWTAIGNSAGINNTTGGFWTAIGRDAGRSNTTGGSWTAIGRDAGRSNLTGESWVAIGLDAGRYINGTTTALEYFENSAYIGTSTKGTNGTVGTPTTNETVIGYAAEGNGSNTVTIGNSSVTDNYLTGKVHVTSSVQVGDDTDTATAANVGAVRYRSDANNSYMDMCMQTGASTYAWVNIKTNTW